MTEQKMPELNTTECTHDCSTCQSACSQEERPKKDFFTMVEDFVAETEKDEIQDMFAKIAEEIGED